MPEIEQAAPPEEWIEQLSNLPDEQDRRRLFSLNSPNCSSLATILYGEVLRLNRVDLARASRVAEALLWLADDLRDEHTRGEALRASAHVSYLTTRYQAALEQYESAIKIFERLGEDVEAARTINAALQSLIYLGQYQQAFQWAEKARRAFVQNRDELRLARLEGNIGNILYRQDRFHEALEHYLHADRFFAQCGDPQDVAITLRNIAVCHISLGQFDEALETYQRARSYTLQHQLPLLVAEADYNIAYLYYLRGEYTQAIDLYQATRALCEKLHDPYHSALCDLDQAEMYLELNLAVEGAELARRAYSGFRNLRMGYEAAKALAFLAIAANQAAKPQRALQLFDRARAQFLAESNHFWPALIDLYKALVLFENGEHGESRQLCGAALQFFRESPSKAKAAVCELLLARIDLAEAKPQDARVHCDAAFQLLAAAESPAVVFQAHVVAGQVAEAVADNNAAVECYRHAHTQLESLRSNLQGEEIKIAFLKDKLSVYENLVHLLLRRSDAAEVAFDYIERAKSRSLADLIAFRVHALPSRAEGAEELTAQVRSLREKLAWAQRQGSREEREQSAGSADRVQRLRRQARDYHAALTKAADQLGYANSEMAALLNAGTKSLAELRATLPQGALVLEYYEARGTLYAAVIGSHTLDIVPVAECSRVRERFRYLQFQLSKFRLGHDYLSAFESNLRAATLGHLRYLHASLIAPIRWRLAADHLIIVPHGFLHYLPFHALTDGGSFLLDEYSISYAPSASVYQLCCAKPEAHVQDALVLGIPDARAPHIAEEASSVASSLPNAKLFVGEFASAELLQRYGPLSRIVHIATHGLFRQDNPMFSSVSLGKTNLSLFDLYQLRLSAELVTLSGCGTGLNVVVGGDELLGLVRGLLYAGAQAVLVSLWDVNDQSTAEFMRAFYQRLPQAANKAIALGEAMRALRQTHPHPFYWAPFVLVGKYL
jgi:CHAT domain-containing protein/tetratricopeptide (TPR) repeat protein